ncbi:cytochrome P450 [Actinomadura rubteroloni]|uniref:cytochrome P450 n=1 Tax=Actinomadura rubteroloni TaxID=1926885 RepID=UPI00143D2003|nr:cytochrome P450 [Actinomadura rubteroloni]
MGSPHPYPFGGGYGNCPGLDVHPHYAWLRENDPVARIRTPEGEEPLLVTRYRDVCRVLARPSVFSREAATTAADGLRDQRFLTDIEGAAHAAQRALIQPFFTRARAEALRARIAFIAGEFVAGMASLGEPADLVRDLAVPLPVAVICEILDIPADERTRFGDWAAAMLSPRPGASDAERASVAAAMDELGRYMAGKLAERAAEPGPDLLSALAVGAGPVPAEDRVTLAAAMLIAGFETTTNMIGNMVHTLLRFHPGLWDALVRDPGLVPTAVDELLRWIPSDARDGMARGATADTSIGGVTVAAGTSVLVARGAANRDPDRFPDPERLDLARTPNPHLTFGHGPHRCPGEHLARVELEAALWALTERFPRLRPADPDAAPRWKRSTMPGLAELPVRWS